MANIIIGSIVFILAVLAIKTIIKSKGTCSCSSNNCHCCSNHCQDKK